MSHPFWQRYLAVGEELATQPVIFPGVVAFLEAIANGSESRELVLRFLESSIPNWTPRQVADVLCRAEPRLTELESELDASLERLSVAERQHAAQWALFTLRGHEPTIPGCVAQLMAMLCDPPEVER